MSIWYHQSSMGTFINWIRKTIVLASFSLYRCKCKWITSLSLQSIVSFSIFWFPSSLGKYGEEIYEVIVSHQVIEFHSTEIYSHTQMSNTYKTSPLIYILLWGWAMNQNLIHVNETLYNYLLRMKKNYDQEIERQSPAY